MDDPLIGREPEREALAALAADASAGDGSIVPLAGEAGVGTSLKSARSSGACVLIEQNTAA